MVAYRTPEGSSERPAHAAALSISVSAKAAGAYGGNAARLQVLKRRVDPDEPPHFQTEILSDDQARLYAVQQPFHKTLLMGKTKDAIWNAKPSYYEFRQRIARSIWTRAVHGQAHRRDHDGDEGEPRVARIRGNRGPNPASRRVRVTGVDKSEFYIDS
jgi:hypothetical protein